ncbi:hypothetical protein OQA88_3467 [Cercophora sp. LCS_1]
MAVIKGIAGLEASIEINGERATEYDAPEDETTPTDLTRDHFFLPEQGPARWDEEGLPVVVKYIAAQPGALFRIRIRKTAEFQQHAHHISFSINLDGSINTSARHEVGHYLPEKATGDWDDYRERWSANDKDGNWQSLYLRFGALDVDGEANYSKEEVASQVALAKQLGVIRVRVDHQLRSSAPYRRPHGRPADHATVDKLGEKALKGRALDCKVALESRPTTAPITFKSFAADNRKRPFALFEFRYRSLDGLMKEGIVSRPSAQPEPEPVQEDKDGANPVHPVVIKPEEGHRVKRERTESESTNAAEFRDKYKTRRLESGRFEIDLTDD